MNQPSYTLGQIKRNAEALAHLSISDDQEGISDLDANTYSTALPPQDKSTLAPSEKHLEDWIVANQDRFCDHTDSEPFAARFVARQFRLPSGISDLIAANDRSIGVIELKRGAINEAVLGQTLRYMTDLKRIWVHAWHYAIEHDYSSEYADLLKYKRSLLAYIPPEINAIVVGHSIPNRALVETALGADIFCVTYSYQDGDYSFHLHIAESPQYRSAVIEIARGVIGDAMRMVMRQIGGMIDE